MADYINITLNDYLEALKFRLRAVNKQDPFTYFNIVPSGTTTPYDLAPTQEVRALVAPSSASLTDAKASGLLDKASRRDNSVSGYYFTTVVNSKDTADKLEFNPVKMTSDWANQKFDLFWIQTLGTYSSMESNTSGVYSYPSNIQTKDVVISGELVSNTGIAYNVRWGEMANDDDALYGVPPNSGAYAMVVTNESTTNYAAGFSSTWKHLDDTMMTSGFVFDLPFYNGDITVDNFPAIYKFQLVNIGPTTLSGDILSLKVDHQQLRSESFFGNLDKESFTEPNPKNLKLVDEITIDNKYILDRKRMSIGVNDIAIKDNAYQKQGTYISPYYNVDFEMYTFSLKVDEVIPDYATIPAYDVIRYYIEFNSNVWEAISPITRGEDRDGTVILPKLFIFDAAPDDEAIGTGVKYLNYNSDISTFRVKIVFDLSALSEAKFAVPEVHDYKCLIFDKDKLNNA